MLETGICRGHGECFKEGAMSGYDFRRLIATTSLAVAFCLGAIRLAAGQPPPLPVGPGPAPPRADIGIRQPETLQPEAPPRVAPLDEEYEPAVTPEVPAEGPEPARTAAAGSPIIRLASVPNMFGDTFGGIGQVVVDDVGDISMADLPPFGGGRHVKIAEDDKALPMDRVFFIYNHFHNALGANSWLLGPNSSSLDRYTIGFEKTFRGGLWSVELRMPFTDGHEYSDDVLLAVEGGDIGDLVVTLKRLLYVSDYTAVAAGLCIETPTGSNVSGQAGMLGYTLHNDAVHLAPFIGFLRTPNPRVFYQGFLQLDLAANANRVELYGRSLEELSEQNLLYIDLSWGYWLYRNPYARGITGVAPMIEYHYTTTLQDADIVSGFDTIYDSFDIVQFGNQYNHVDVSNLTIGLHTELAGRNTVRVAGVLPLSQGHDRAFDAEVQVSLDRRY
jgi:hypothetical protein